MKLQADFNIDSLKSGIGNLGWMYNSSSQYFYDVFDRKGWEPKAVNYTLYKTMYWSDGNDKPLTKLEVKDIRKFLNKRNISE